MKLRGSITVFLALSMSGVLLLFFLLLDLARLEGQRQKAEVISDIAAQSVFADYNRYLWDNYRILAVDASYGSGGGADFSQMETRMREYLLKNGLSPDVKGIDLYQLSTEKCEVLKYGMLTDQNGRAFLKQAVCQQKTELPQQAVEAVLNRNGRISSDGDSAGDVEAMISDGDGAIQSSRQLLEDVKRNREETESENQDVSEQTSVTAVSLAYTVTTEEQANYPVDIEGGELAQTEINPIDQIKSFVHSGILAQVLPGSAQISESGIDLSDAVSRRTLAAGNTSSEEKLNAAEKIIFADYEKTHFSSYRNDLGHDGLKYEWEYVLCGKDTDKGNLASTVSKLLALREAENFLSLQRDRTKLDQADVHALALAGWTGNEAIVMAVYWGLLAAWSYMESVLDVRLLLAGGKVPLVKEPQEWTIGNLLELAAWIPVENKAVSSENGVSYEDYLLSMSALQKQKTLGLRSLDLLENALHRQEHYQNSHVDQMVVSADFSYEYSSQPAFFSLFELSAGAFPVLKINESREMTYLTQ